jgi:tRNA-dihydrouridine synthase B
MFMLASLERYSDSVFRTLSHNHGADLTFTEMAHVESFLRGNRISLEKIRPRDTTPVQIQLLTGSDDKLDRFLSTFSHFDGFKGFNLNLSCPSKDVIRQGKGAAMIKRGAKTARLVTMIRDHGHPVSVKLRLGLNQIEKDKKLYLNNLGKVDPDFFVVHAKHAAQGSGEREDNSVYPECVEAARGIPVIANGGIETPEKARSLIEMGVGGVMMGRPAIGNPGVFDYLKNMLGVNNPPRPVPQIDELQREYNDLFEAIGGSEKYRSRFLKAVGKTRAHY